MLFWIDYGPFLLPGILLTVWAQARLVRALAAGSRVSSAAGLTGAESAEVVMQAGNVTGVEIEPASGELSDHYDSSRKVLRLSRGVFDGRSLAAVGVAAHEAGHAIQDAARHPGLIVRTVIVPWTGLGSQVVWIIFAAGILLGMTRLIVLAMTLFSLLLILQLVNLPVELDASRRGREILLGDHLVTAEEDEVVARVSNAAAWTHVAETLTGVFALFGARRLL